MNVQALINIAIIASPIVAIASLLWTILWSRKVLREARQSRLVEEVEEIKRMSEKAHARIDGLDSKVDALPTAAAISQIDGDIREIKAQYSGIRDLMDGLTNWMARMDTYLHNK